MRLACLVLVITALSASAKGKAQLYPLHYTNADVRVIFVEIRKQIATISRTWMNTWQEYLRFTINENKLQLEDVLKDFI